MCWDKSLSDQNIIFIRVMQSISRNQVVKESRVLVEFFKLYIKNEDACDVIQQNINEVE